MTPLSIDAELLVFARERGMLSVTLCPRLNSEEWWCEFKGLATTPNKSCVKWAVGGTGKTPHEAALSAHRHIPSAIERALDEWRERIEQQRAARLGLIQAAPVRPAKRSRSSSSGPKISGDQLARLLGGLPDFGE